MNSKIWLSSPHMGGNELNYIHEAFDSNWVAPLGPNVDGFENDLEQYVGQDTHVVVLSSGTAALHLALIQCGISYGDEVICQSMTFSASANPIAYQGATPIFVDSEIDTWNICPIALEEAIVARISKGKKPKAIIAVHLYGMPFKVDEVLAVANKYGIPLIEDAAEALGSTYKGQACGTFGDFGVLSFNGNKIITTSGGGALACRTQGDKERTVFLSTQARDHAPHYEHSHIGYNYRMSNICAGIGRGQMEVLDDRVAARRDMTTFYKEVFSSSFSSSLQTRMSVESSLQEISSSLQTRTRKGVDGVTVFAEPSSDYFSNHWLAAIVIDPIVSGKTREELRLAFLEDNIESRPLWKPMHMQPVFADAPYYGGHVAEQLFANGLCLPSGSNLTDPERERIKKVIVDFFGL